MMNNESRISDIEQVEQRIKNVQDDFNQIKTLRENLVNLRIQTDEIIESNKEANQFVDEVKISRDTLSEHEKKVEIFLASIEQVEQRIKKARDDFDQTIKLQDPSVKLSTKVHEINAANKEVNQLLDEMRVSRDTIIGHEKKSEIFLASAEEELTQVLASNSQNVTKEIDSVVQKFNKISDDLNVQINKQYETNNTFQDRQNRDFLEFKNNVDTFVTTQTINAEIIERRVNDLIGQIQSLETLSRTMGSELSQKQLDLEGRLNNDHDRLRNEMSNFQSTVQNTIKQNSDQIEKITVELEQKIVQFRDELDDEIEELRREWNPNSDIDWLPIALSGIAFIAAISAVVLALV